MLRRLSSIPQCNNKNNKSGILPVH